MEVSNATSVNESVHRNITSEFTTYNIGDEFISYTGTYYWLEIIVRIGITGTLAIYGVGTNIVNIIIFYRQGILSDSCNASLLFLTLSDLTCCILSTWACVCYLIMNAADMDEYRWVVFDICIATALRPKRMFTQTTVWITAYVAFERCFCVVFPFKAKSIFNAKRSFVVTGLICVSIIALCFSQYAEMLPVWREVHGKNFSRFTYRRNENLPWSVVKAFIILNAFVLRITAIVVIYICNFILIWKINISKKFKLSSTVKGKKSSEQDQHSSNKNSDRITSSGKGADNSDKYGQKEKRLMRMVTALCSLTLICYTPDTFIVVVNQLVKRIPFDIYLNLLVPTEVMETFNSSVNIHIYYTMSTRYRNEFSKWIGGKKKK